MYKNLALDKTAPIVDDYKHEHCQKSTGIKKQRPCCLRIRLAVFAYGGKALLIYEVIL